MKVAIVHPWFIMSGGGEKVVDALARLYPAADFFALMASEEHIPPAARGRRMETTFLNRLPGAKRYYQHVMPLYPLAAQQLDLSGYNLVISSGGPAVKGVLVPQDAVHVHYCHSPVRFLWDQFPVWQKRVPRLVRPFFDMAASSAREWDFNSAQRVDGFAANSNHVAQRIATYYRRKSTTVYPPVSVNREFDEVVPGDYYLSVGRLVPGKRTDLVVGACTQLRRRLIVVGTGPEEGKLRALAGQTVSFVGRIDDEALQRLYRGARAFVLAAEEDFGIATVEAQSFGLPAIAYGKGGSHEIVDGPSEEGGPAGLLFREQTVECFVQALEAFERSEQSFDRRAIWRRSQRFGEDVFARNMLAFVEETSAAAIARGQ